MSCKSTHEILASIKGRLNPDLWQRITGIPEFDPVKHSDGCSGGMSAGYQSLCDELKIYGKDLPWRECCVIHDQAYYYGGSREEKKAADKALKKCVAQKLGDTITGRLLGEAMESAVRIGGVPYLSTDYRWGYGEDFRNTEMLPAKTDKK